MITCLRKTHRDGGPPGACTTAVAAAASAEAPVEVLARRQKVAARRQRVQAADTRRSTTAGLESRDRRDVPLEQHAEHGLDVLLPALVPEAYFGPAPQVLGRVIWYELRGVGADQHLRYPCSLSSSRPLPNFDRSRQAGRHPFISKPPTRLPIAGAPRNQPRALTLWTRHTRRRHNEEQRSNERVRPIGAALPPPCGLDLVRKHRDLDVCCDGLRTFSPTRKIQAADEDDFSLRRRGAERSSAASRGRGRHQAPG